MKLPGVQKASWPAMAGGFALLALAAVAFAHVRPTNFRGFDEWVVLSLLSRGIMDYPYANRPLGMLWALPAWMIAPDRLWGFLVVHATWIGLSGVLVFLLARRLLRTPSAFALLAGAFAILWAPSDATRLCSVQMTLYSGSTFGVLLALWLLVEGWSRRLIALAIAGAAAGVAAAMSIEVALAPLAFGPLLLLLAGAAREPRRLAAWTASWFALLLATGLRAVVPLWTDPERFTYQMQFQAPNLSPRRITYGLLQQLRAHLQPLADLSAAARALPLVAVALAVLLAGLLVLRPRGEEGPDAPGPPRRSLLAAALLGLAWALASYLPFVLSPKTQGPVRTQFFSTPGVAVLLAAVLVGVASFLPRRARFLAAALLGAWVVAVGIGRSVALQAVWDLKSAYPNQRKTLLELTTLAPDLAPGTLVVLLARGPTWHFDFSFRHAVRYLYEGRAVGHVAGADDLLYRTLFEDEGARSLPIPTIRGPWGEPALLYGYDAIVVLREGKKGRLELLEAWPDGDLPPLPEGAVYAPRLRLRGGAPPRRLAILGPP